MAQPSSGAAVRGRSAADGSVRLEALTAGTYTLSVSKVKEEQKNPLDIFNELSIYIIIIFILHPLLLHSSIYVVFFLLAFHFHPHLLAFTYTVIISIAYLFIFFIFSLTITLRQCRR